MRQLITDAIAAGAAAPELIVHDTRLGPGALQGMRQTPAADRIFYEVAELSRMGLEMQLAALAYGAGRISLLCDPDTPLAIREALEGQAKLGARLLQGINIKAERLFFTVYRAPGRETEFRAAERDLLARSTPEPMASAATFAPDHDKRGLLRLALQHLAESSGAAPARIALPEGAPFGGLSINAAACTLCMACVSACPAAALVSGVEGPLLALVESGCHQCGLCREACPEDAITLLPRFLLEAADRPVVLREVEPFRCIECDRPFTSESMVRSMQEKLTGHWMYSNVRQLSRLRMCRTCRTRDALLAEDFQA
jgi:ferredoxin